MYYACTRLTSFISPTDLNISVTSDPSTASVTQNNQAMFTCEATGFGDFDIKWEVDGILYDEEVCDDMENCTVTDSTSGHTSTLELYTEHIEPSTLTIVCVVNQTLPDKASLENDTTEVILPRTTSKTMRHEGVQLEIMPSPPTTPATGAISTSPPGMHECGNINYNWVGNPWLACP